VNLWFLKAFHRGAARPDRPSSSAQSPPFSGASSWRERIPIFARRRMRRRPNFIPHRIHSPTGQLASRVSAASLNGAPPTVDSPPRGWRGKLGSSRAKRSRHIGTLPHWSIVATRRQAVGERNQNKYWMSCAEKEPHQFNTLRARLLTRRARSDPTRP
jgi:hypothetical protein